jgi:hypothetical protein
MYVCLGFDLNVGLVLV